MSTASADRPRTALAGWWDAILIYKQPRVLAMLFLGFSAGLPFMLVFQTLSAWLRQEGIERATIGMLAWVGLAYSIKFLWAPIVDHFKLPLLHRLLGRRRSWMLVAQIGIGIGLANLSHANPSMSVQFVALSALFIAICSATQDIALDAWRIESAPPEMQGGMAAAYQLGYRVAIIAGTAGALWIASESGWRTAYSTMAALMLVGIITTLLVREPDISSHGEKTEPPKVTEWRRAHAHWPSWLRAPIAWLLGSIVEPVADFFRRYGVVAGLIIFGFIGGYRLTDYAMGVMTNSFYIDHGYTLKQVATIVKIFGVMASMVGVVIGGIVVAKMGVVRALVFGSVMIMMSNCGFAILATTTSPNVVGLGAVNVFDFIALGIHGTALIAFLSSLTSASHTATQYAVLSSLYALPGKLLMGTSGFVVEAIDYPAFFLYTASLSIPALALLFRARPPISAPAAGAKGPTNDVTIRHTICNLSDLPDPGSRAFSIGEGDWPLRGFLVRKGQQVFAYVNRCPHAGHPLNWRPDEFLTPDQTLIMCRSHGALFDIDGGRCVAGPCAGRALQALKTHIEDDLVFLDDPEIERFV